jgi:hypothetical protein
MRTRTTMRDRGSASNIGWIAGALVVLLLLGALAFTWNRDGDTTAGTNPNASAPASTTGSAGTTGSGSTGPASNVPQSKPAPAPAR